MKWHHWSQTQIEVIDVQFSLGFVFYNRPAADGWWMLMTFYSGAVHLDPWQFMMSFRCTVLQKAGNYPAHCNEPHHQPTLIFVILSFLFLFDKIKYSTLHRFPYTGTKQVLQINVRFDPEFSAFWFNKHFLFRHCFTVDDELVNIMIIWVSLNWRLINLDQSNLVVS